MAEVQVGPYRILERLGAGANGVVFLAEDTRLHRRVALKTVAGTAGSEASEVRRKLLREARAAARLNHPNIAAVYDVLESDDGVHIVMEYVPGTTLAARVRSGPLPHTQVLDLGLQLSSALAHAHELGVVHRDLKPANVVMSPAGQAKILDFGLARVNALEAGSAPVGSSDLTATDARQVVGTPPYMPPELLRGEGYDARSDIYSLGVTLFELLTGRRPFEARDGVALTAAILTAPTPRPRSVAADVPAPLDEVVFRTIMRDPRERYRSAADLEHDLKRLAAGITDEPTTAFEPRSLLWSHGQRRLGWALMSAMAVAVAVYAAAGPAQRLWRPSGTPSPAATRAEVIAVLPMASDAPDHTTLAIGVTLADALITRLSKVQGLSVVSRTATAEYGAGGRDLARVARDLGATLVIDGAFQRTADKLTLTLGLVDPRTRAVRWQETFDCTAEALPELQVDVVDGVLRAIRPTTGMGESAEPLSRNAEALAEYSQGRAFLDRRDVPANVDRAIGLFQSAVAKDAGFARAHGALGEAYRAKYLVSRDSDLLIAARDASIEALRLDPNDPAVRYSLAVIYRTIGRDDQAISELQALVAAYPAHDEGHALLGEMLGDKGQAKEGVAALRRAIELRPGYWRHHQSLGLAYYAMGLYADAETAFKRVIELQPDSAWGYQALGTVYHASGDLDQALENYQRAIQLGSDAFAYSNMGTILYGRGEFEKALKLYKTAAELEPKSATKHRNLGDVYLKLGRPREASDHYRRAVALLLEQLRTNPVDASALARLAVCEAKLGRHREAGGHAQKAVSLAPTDTEIRYKQAVVHVLAGDRDAGLQALEVAVQGGYSTSVVGRDEDLLSLRADPRFLKLIGGTAPTGATGGGR
jgi:serine/threonine-protein kinase